MSEWSQQPEAYGEPSAPLPPPPSVPTGPVRTVPPAPIARSGGGRGRRPPRGPGRWIALVLGLLLLFVVTALVTLAVLGYVETRRQAGASATTPAGDASQATTQTAVAPLVQVTEGITGEASSALAGDEYSAARTLDGDLATAWNSNGAADGTGAGISLTYTFATPVDLRRVELANGYQKVGSDFDRYPANGRIQQATVTTDAGQWTWDLLDSRDPQSLTQDFGTTSTFTLVIDSVYPGERFADLGVSEIAFFGQAPG